MITDWSKINAYFNDCTLKETIITKQSSDKLVPSWNGHEITFSNRLRDCTTQLLLADMINEELAKEIIERIEIWENRCGH